MLKGSLLDEYVVLVVWCIGSDYMNLFSVDGVVKR